jgi:diaminobutyrate-2-oxoglutarate transaminase
MERQAHVIDPVSGATDEELRRRHAGLRAPYCLDGTPALERQARVESNARTYPRRIPLVLQRAHGIYVEDSRGQVYIDCLAGAGTLALGHNHPVAVEALRAALASELPLHTLDLWTPTKEVFVEELFACLPEAFGRSAKIQFCGPSGADAVEAALKLAKSYTGRSGLLAFHGAYHGMTQGTLSISGNLGPKRALGALLPEVQFLPYPYDYRCPFGVGGDAAVEIGLQYLGTVLQDPESGVRPPAAAIVEPIQGEGGVIAAPPRWLAGVRELTRQAGVTLILDEIQTGIGRTGRMFGFQHAAITPDVLVLSKAIGGGLPLAVVLYREEMDVWEPGAHAGTFRGHQLAMAAGAATLRFIRTEKIADHAAAVGARLKGHLQALQKDRPWVGDVRGQGLMLGMEIVDPSGSPDALGHAPVDPARARWLQRECLRRGLILELGGRHGATIRLLPPLITTAEDADFIAEILQAAAASGM